MVFLNLLIVRNHHGVVVAAELSQNSHFVQKKMNDGLQFHIPFSSESYCVALFCSRCGEKIVGFDCIIGASVNGVISHTYFSGGLVCMSCSRQRARAEWVDVNVERHRSYTTFFCLVQWIDCFNEIPLCARRSINMLLLKIPMIRRF